MARKTPRCICRPTAATLPRIIAAAIVFAIIAQVIHTLGAQFGMGYYTDPAYFSVWSTLMMPPMTSFLYYSIGFAFVTGILLAMAYTIIGCCLPGKTDIRRGLVYGILLFLVAGIPGALSTYLLINIPAVLILMWAVENLVIYLAGGAAIARISR